MGADVVENRSVEFVDVVAETYGWCVKDLVRGGWVVALGRHEGCVAEFFDALDFRFEFAAPFRSRVEEGLPASACVFSLERVLAEGRVKGWPKRWGVVGALHLWGGARHSIDVERTGPSGASAEATLGGSGFHEISVKELILFTTLQDDFMTTSQHRKCSQRSDFSSL